MGTEKSFAGSYDGRIKFYASEKQMKISNITLKNDEFIKIFKQWTTKSAIYMQVIKIRV